MKHWLVYFFCIFFTEFSGFVTGMLIRDATVIYTQSIIKPPLSPPPTVFPIVWTVLYALMGIGLARILLQEHSNLVNTISPSINDAKESQQSASIIATEIPSLANKHGEITRDGAHKAKRHLSERTKATWFFFAQLFFNLGWSYIFFLYQMFGVAFIWLLILLVLVIAMTIVFYKQDKVASLIQLPYIFWMFFATYLNAGVFLLNR